MDKGILQVKLADYPGLDAMMRADLADGRFSVQAGGSRFECLFIRKPADRLFVVLHGARDPRAHAIPIFRRWSWHEMFPGSVLYVSDPTLELDPEHMQLGWYLGRRENDPLDGLTQLVAGLAERLGLATRQVIAYGSSGGGFAALMLAARLGDATAVSINGQSNILKYHRKFVNRALELVFDCKNPAGLAPEEMRRMDAIAAFSRAHKARCLYVQNIRDEPHFNNHYLPFCRALKAPEDGGVDETGRICTLLFDDPNGHGGEPKAIAPVILKLATDVAAGIGRESLLEYVKSHSAVLQSTTIPLTRRKGAGPDGRSGRADQLKGGVMDEQNKGKAPQQAHGVEGRNIRKVLLEMLPKNGVGAEIGVHLGDFSEQILGHATPKKLFLIDPWRFFPDPEHQESWYGESGAQGQAEMDRRHARVCARFQEQIAGGRVEVKRGLSQDVLAGLPDGHLDWIYIDGDHSYEAVKRDLELSFNKVRKGGFIAGDDYQLGKWWKDGVVRAVNEFIGTRPILVKFMRNGQFLLRKIGK